MNTDFINMYMLCTDVLFTETIQFMLNFNFHFSYVEDFDSNDRITINTHVDNCSI